VTNVDPNHSSSNSANTYRAPKDKPMAKGQTRSNREIRKPKKDKSAAAAPAPSGSQVKLAGGHTASVSKK